MIRFSRFRHPAGQGARVAADMRLAEQPRVCLAQLATHPAVWFVWPLLGWSRPVYLVAAEAGGGAA